ncbi:hypothetical protein ACROYT_G002440 [Oculina patagonica]
MCGKIYFSDFIFERIEVANLDGTSRKTLFTTDLYSPRGIAVDPKSGYMFWTDYGFDFPRIERADLTGDNRMIVVTFGYDWWYQFFPISVVIDYEHDPERIFWIDRIDNYIDYADLNGNNKTNLEYINENIHPVDLALYGDTLYWADRNSHSIQWFNTTQSLGMHFNFGHLTDDYLTGVVVSDKSRQPVVSPSPCCINNGGCSHLCLLAPGGGSKCACPNGVELLPGNKTCSNATQPKPPPPPVPDLKVRLSGSNSSNEGRVEVYYLGRWGTVCNDHWGIREASVLCKMLNFSGASRVDYFGPGNESFPIWMDNVKCRGDEQSIAACRHRGWDNHDCSHFEDAGVVCRNNSIPPTEGPTLAPGPHPELKVHLRSGTTSNQGRVELYLNGTWGTICDDYWGIEEANVICRMLNFTEGAWSTHCCGWYDGFTAPNQIWLDDVHCVGDELSIAECRHGGWGSHNCRHSEDVGVVCKYTPVTAPGQKLRLADGIRGGEGRVEIFHDGHWGTVCDDFWDIKDAQVVCNQLGYPEAIAAPKNALFGEGNGHIWLSDVHCEGNESSIEDCEHAAWNANQYCFHFEDASVICSNETGSLDADDFLLFCESGRKLCYFIPLPLASPAQIIPLKIAIDSTPAGISYDPIEKRIYWTDLSGSINRAFLHNSSQETVVRGISYPMGIEVDVIGRTIYVADYYINNIRVASLDGVNQAVLVDVQYPQGIALDSISGYIYYSSVGDSLQIYRADMDGTNQMILANLSFVGDDTFVDLVLDKSNNRLYFSDQTNEVIRYIDLGSPDLEIHTLLSGNLHKPSSLAMLNGILYWTAPGDGSFSGAVFKANVTGNSVSAETVADSFGRPKGIYAYNSMATQIPVQSPCQNNNGGCAQLCVLKPNGRTCMCGAGMKTAEDGISCTLSDVIIVTDIDHDKIYFSDLSENLLNPLPFSNIERPTGVAFDPFEDRMYWTDPTHGIVARAKIDGTNQETIRFNVTAMGIDLDLVGGNVYWINSGNRTVEVSKLNGEYWKVLVSNLSSAPVDIALDTTRGFMYWSAEGVIEGAQMDGSNRSPVADLGETWYGAPVDAKGLTVDVEMNRIYFVSYEEYSLFYVDLDSANRTVQTLIQNFWLFLGPFGVAVDDQYVYWTEYIAFGYVFRTNKTASDDDNTEVVLHGTYNPRGIAVKKGNPTRDNDHPCRTSNGDCTHLCLTIPSGYTCGCPTVVDDGQDCSTSPITTPPPTQPTTPTTVPTTVPVDYCTPDPCQNGATCTMLGTGYKCDCQGYYGGVNCSVDISTEVVELILEISLEEFNITEFINSIVEALNEECALNPLAPECSTGESTESIVKRAVQGGPYTPDDIYLPTDPKEVDGGVQVEYAVVKTSTDGEPVVVPSTFVAEVTEKKAAEIGRKLGGNVKSVRQKPVEKPTAAPQTGKSSGGLIAGVVVAVGLVVIIAAFTVWYFRVKKTRSANVPYVKEDDDDRTKSRTTAFENPGFGAAEGYDDIGPVVFAPFEENVEAGGVSNPTYAEIGMTSMSSSQNINTAGAAGNSAASDGPHYEGVGELPKKTPLGKEEEVQPDHVEIVVQKETPAQEEPRYESLFPEKSKEAKNDQTEVEVEKVDEPRYETLSVRQEIDQTVLVLEDNSQRIAESES